MKTYRWKVVARGYVEALSPGEAVEELTSKLHGYVSAVEDEWALYVEGHVETDPLYLPQDDDDSQEEYIDEDE